MQNIYSLFQRQESKVRVLLDAADDSYQEKKNDSSVTERVIKSSLMEAEKVRFFVHQQQLCLILNIL